MPDNTPNTNPNTFPDPATNNAEVAKKLAAQDIMGQSTVADPAGPAGQALDALAAEVQKKSETPPVNEPPPGQTPEEKAKAEAEAKAKAESDAKVAAEREENLKKADTLFKDAPQLAPNASPKSSEAFAEIKIRAAREISAKDAELEKLRKDKAELEQKLKTQAPLTPEVVKELEDHRTWRAKLDVDADPKFKEFDKQITQATDFIYFQLKKSPAVSDSIIEQIKKLGGPDKTDFTKLWAAVNDPALQRIVESKIADIEAVKFNKQQAIDAAKANVQQYMQERQQAFAKSVTAHRDNTVNEYNQMAGALEWFKPKTVADNADAAAKKAVEDHNSFVEDTKKQIQAALHDDSPQMRAIMLVGMAQLFNLQREHAALKSEKEGLASQVAELTDKLDRIKKASVNRLRESGAAPGAAAEVAKKPADAFNIPATQALDNIARQVMETQRQAANTGR